MVCFVLFCLFDIVSVSCDLLKKCFFKIFVSLAEAMSFVYRQRSCGWIYGIEWGIQCPNG